MSLSEPMTTVLCKFAPAFSQPTWRKVQVLIVGHAVSPWAADHDRRPPPDGPARGIQLSSLSSRTQPCALVLLVRTFVAVGGDLTFVIDETLERRWGRRIAQRGHYRDPLASSTQRSV